MMTEPSAAVPVRVRRLPMRIAQMVLARVPLIEWEEVDEPSPTARSGGGFGHTGTA